MTRSSASCNVAQLVTGSRNLFVQTKNDGTFSFDNMVAAFKQTGQELGVAAFDEQIVPYRDPLIKHVLATQAIRTLRGCTFVDLDAP